PPTPPLFPYTTLFRSHRHIGGGRIEPTPRRHAGAQMQEISVRLRETPRVPDQMSDAQGIPPRGQNNIVRSRDRDPRRFGNDARRSEEHTSELQSRSDL